MEDKKVSILVPVYGVEKYIERCARSLFEQNYGNIEYIFVDDCTKDKSIDILQDVLQDYPNRKCQVKIIHHERNRGLSAARNTALDASTGDFLMHVDSDDYLRKDAVDRLINTTNCNDAECVIFGYSIVNNEKVTNQVIEHYDKEELINRYLQNKIPASMWNKFYNAKFYKGTGVRSIEGVNQGEDYAVVPRIIYEVNKIEWLDENLYYYEQSNISSYSNNITEASVKSMKKADDVLFEFFINKDDKDIYSKSLKVLYVRSALFLIKTGDFSSLKRINKYYAIDRKCFSLLSITDRILVVLFISRMNLFLTIAICIFKKIIR